MSYQLPCECGAAVSVNTADAGNEITCRCGRMIVVPQLSQLREMTGKAAYEVGPIDTIRRLQREGKLPNGIACEICHRPTDETCEFYVECETHWLKRPSTLGMVSWLLVLLLAPLGPLFYFIERNAAERASEIHGRERGVAIRLRICSDHERELKRLRRSKLRSLLRHTKAYADLLDEFPGARVRRSS